MEQAGRAGQLRFLPCRNPADDQRSGASLGAMMAALDGLNILVPESRELDMFASMLEAEGATATRCPLVRIAELEDTQEADAWIARMIAAPFDDTLLLTGEGLRKLLALSGERRQAFIAALEKTRLVVRGPKPVKAFREIGLAPALTAVSPTSEGILETLEKENLKGRKIGVQLYPGEGARPLVQTLRARGAEVFPVTPYRYADETESVVVADIIRDLAQGRFGLIAFTSSPQIERLFEVAREFGLTLTLEAGLSRTPIAAVGPVMEAALQARGLRSVIHPKTSFHLKPMVRAIVNWRNG
jgi:uroporphyrinogen-III synthase